MGRREGGILQKWRAAGGGAMYINLVLKSLMVTSFEDARRRKRATSARGNSNRGARGSTVNIIYGTQNDNLPATVRGPCNV
jgi:hypothetical protein